ncbi:MAG: hypothetical protein M1838_004072, partial [Thelocarpon superellum]
MSRLPLSLALASLVTWAHSLPTDPSPPPTPPWSGSGCGPVASLFNQSVEAWNTANTGPWLDAWWAINEGTFNNTDGGFAAEFGRQFLGNPDWTCRDDGSGSDCDLDPCGVAALNNAGADMAPAYYVLESTNRLHSYFAGLSQSLETSAIGAALATDSWTETFYTYKGAIDMSGLKELIGVLETLVGIAAAAAGPFAVTLIEQAALGATRAIFTAAGSAATAHIKQGQDDTFQKAADVGAALSQLFMASIKDMVTGNNVLMGGNSFEGAGDIRTFIQNGSYVAFEGIDKVATTNSMNAMLTGAAINRLWRQQKVYIMGGGACDDSSGLGTGPQANKVCRDGKAWYLYFWDEDHHWTLTHYQWGWVDGPPGADQLGTGEYAGITVQDVINSSLDAYNVAEYAYTYQTLHDNALDALSTGLANPAASGPAWQGIFNIP